VTYDIHRQVDGGEKLATSEYAGAIVDEIQSAS
jgi:isocitrate dehydrogenase